MDCGIIDEVVGDALVGKKARFQTLGCKLNFAEAGTIQNLLEKEGVSLAGQGERADICIVNTCSVTEVSDHKCRQAIRKLLRENPSSCMVVLGCYAQLKPQDVENIKGVDLLLGMENKGNLVPLLRRYFSRKENFLEGDSPSGVFVTPTREIRTFVPSCSRGDRTRYFLKVQDGCDYYCTYCTIPYARGKSRNPSISSLVRQAELVAKEGGREIVLTGVNIGDFGKTTGENFLNLVKSLDNVEGIDRYRISSIEPNLLTDEVIDYCVHSRAFMPHFHIPLQAGSDEVLRLMHRHYDTDFFFRKIESIKEKLPDAFIGVDVIVGTKGETDRLFEETVRFIEKLNVSQLHVFSYSERPGTQALRMDGYVVSPEEKHCRSNRLMELSNRKHRAFYEQFVGTSRCVLLEHSRKGKPLQGFTDNYIRVEMPSSLSGAEWDNQLVKVKLGNFNHDGSALLAEIENRI